MKASFSFQTLHLPPPFAYAYTLKLEVLDTGTNVEFGLEYLNRDTITEEEILEEGYSTEDNFQWKGKLHRNWSSVLKESLKKIKLTKAPDEGSVWLFAEVDTDKGNVKNPEKWEFTLQEVIQAIYEESGKEYPLKMNFLHLQKGSRIQYSLTASFARRESSVNQKKISWESMNALMKLVFAMDFEESPTFKPVKEGLWVDYDGSGGFYKTEKATDQLLKILQ